MNNKGIVIGIFVTLLAILVALSVVSAYHYDYYGGYQTYERTVSSSYDRYGRTVFSQTTFVERRPYYRPYYRPYSYTYFDPRREFYSPDRYYAPYRDYMPMRYDPYYSYWRY
ncbi:hypothetical protein HYV49_06315 [Candidatus Pacearchaeota archaeon]|nr:hypothetical protein [Candidatus Pacearchaeota archaeon]